jgi:uncharacterized membrane protein
MKLKSRRVRSMAELGAMEDKSPAVCGPSRAACAARYSLRPSRKYVEIMRAQPGIGNGEHLLVPRRRKLVSA